MNQKNTTLMLLLAVLNTPQYVIADSVEPLILAYTDISELADMEVIALRGDMPQNSLRNISFIDSEQLDSQQPVSVPDALKYIPNVTTSGGPRDTVQSVNIRGLAENRVLQLIDGVRQNFESGHRPTYFLDPALLKQLEVVKGPTSSLWGSGALAGVVSSNTIHASDFM